MSQSLLNYTTASLGEYLQGNNFPKFHARQILKWVHQSQVLDFAQMTDLKLALRQKLDEQFAIKPLEVALDSVSLDGTRKFLFRLPEGNSLVETVYIPDANRGTLCISSQVGCMLTCTFCATGKQGFERNLTLAELIGQVLSAKIILQQAPLTNIVFMGMGEPLLNIEAVIASCNLLRDDNYYGIARRRVTVSTSGVIPGIYSLAQEADVALALSLHAPTNDLRNVLVPINRKYPLEQLLPACQDYVKLSKVDHILIEYVMLQGVNDSLEQAAKLAKLLSSLPCKINLIPFNTFKGTSYQASTMPQIYSFQQFLQRKGYIVTIRRTRGEQVDAACGQLKGQVVDKTKRQEQWRAKWQQ